MRFLKKAVILVIVGTIYAFGATSAGKVSEVYYDSMQYTAYAKNLIQTGIYGLHKGQPDSQREPGYSVFLAGEMLLLKRLHRVPDLESIERVENIYWVKWLQALALFMVSALTAFGGVLPKKIQWPFFLLCVLSPSLWGANREIYSEVLAILLSIHWIFWVGLDLRKDQLRYKLGSGFVFGCLVLTKAYLMYLSPVFLLTGLCLIFKRPKPKVATLLLFTGVISLFMNSAWTYRNRVTLGENAATSRFSIALAGKVARIDQMKFPEELPVALAASMGSNFCDEHFGPPSCERFDYRGCDKVGIRVLGEYSDQFGSKVLVENNIVRDMRRLFFRRPGIQLLGSFLEILRMGFFEAVLDTGTLPALMVPWARAWHAIGSALIWFLILLGLKELYFKYSSVDTSHRGLFWLFGGVIVYHFSTMSQVTNVVRYIFPVIPFLYLFASVGLASGIERVKVWRS